MDDKRDLPVPFRAPRARNRPTWGRATCSRHAQPRQETNSVTVNDDGIIEDGCAAASTDNYVSDVGEIVKKSTT